ncbi:MAG: efflux RND transporter periplasmic adaptor subunit [Acidobacteria bacterium]|nr:efflux RND transporter periplasmic adaptor subunit [Acidobacteriota bacterium]
MSRAKAFLPFVFVSFLPAQPVETARVVSQRLNQTASLTGEFLPYQSVDLHARVTGFVEKVLVDRGSVVQQGDLLVVLSAPEMEAQIAEAQAKVRAAESQVSEAQARLLAAQSTYEGLKTASATAGAIAGNELTVAEMTVEAARGAVSSAQAARGAAQAHVTALEKLQAYLNIRAPFAGVINERYVHPGALAGPANGPLLKLEQVSRLRLVVAVPEAHAGAIARGARVPFSVAAHPTRTFAGAIARRSRSVDARTRTMAVELDVSNGSGALAPGMYAQVKWPVRTGRPTLLVPATSIVTTTERMFVVRVRGGRAEWVDVKRGARDTDMVEVFGDLRAGDVIVRRGSDEIRDGTALQIKGAS